jgi:glycosyltransferase involved in cell wall biosynthesis
MSDICGDAAVLFDGEDPQDIANRISSVLSDPSRREQLSRRAMERAKQFSWQRGAEKVYQLFQQLGPRASNRGDSAISPERNP